MAAVKGLRSVALLASGLMLSPAPGASQLLYEPVRDYEQY